MFSFLLSVDFPHNKQAYNTVNEDSFLRTNTNGSEGNGHDLKRSGQRVVGGNKWKHRIVAMNHCLMRGQRNREMKGKKRKKGTGTKRI